jgi:hypothetical protein
MRMMSSRLPVASPTTRSHSCPHADASARDPERRHRGLGRWLAAAALAIVPSAHAAWFVWETVELPMSSGASCGNGTPYRFFVNRTPFSNDFTLMFEGGGACWDQLACEGEGVYSATNADGVPTNYLSLPNAAAGGLVTPFTARLDPFQSVATQDWNMVYLPYCTGDVHTGNAVVVFGDADPQHPRTQHFAGQANIAGASSWIRQHMGRPGRLLLTGFSAGGVAATAQYAIARDTLAPSGRTTLLADSGPLFNAPLSGTPEQYPSLPLQTKIRSTWGLDGPQGMIATLAAKLPGLDTSNMGSLSPALAQKYPNDRFGYMLFEDDQIFSGFSYYDFYPYIQQEPDPAKRAELMHDLWMQDIAQWKPTLESRANISYWLPWARDFNGSHCLTIIDFSGTGMIDQGYTDVTPFINANLGRGQVLRKTADNEIPGPIDAALQILAIVMELFGL